MLDSIKQGHISYIINILGEEDQVSNDGFLMRRYAVEHNITMFTSLDTVTVLLDVLEEITIGISTIDA